MQMQNCQMHEIFVGKSPMQKFLIPIGMMMLQAKANTVQ